MPIPDIYCAHFWWCAATLRTELHHTLKYNTCFVVFLCINTPLSLCKKRSNRTVGYKPQFYIFDLLTPPKNAKLSKKQLSVEYGLYCRCSSRLNWSLCVSFLINGVKTVFKLACLRLIQVWGKCCLAKIWMLFMCSCNRSGRGKMGLCFKRHICSDGLLLLSATVNIFYQWYYKKLGFGI